MPQPEKTTLLPALFWRGVGEDFDECEDADDLGASLATRAMLTAATAPFWGPAAATSGDSRTSRLLSRPYTERNLGNIQYAWPTHPKQTWTGRARLEYLGDLDRLDGFAGQLQYELLSGWGFQAAAARRSHLDGLTEDPFRHGDATLTYRFAFSERVQFRAGVGAIWLNSDARDSIGWSFAYDVDAFLVRPLIWSLETDLGRFGGDSLVHFRTTVGANWRHWEPYLGWDHFQVGAQPQNAILVGLRLWY